MAMSSQHFHIRVDWQTADRLNDQAKRAFEDGDMDRYRKFARLNAIAVGCKTEEHIQDMITWCLKRWQAAARRVR